MSLVLIDIYNRRGSNELRSLARVSFATEAIVGQKPKSVVQREASLLQEDARLLYYFIS